MPPAAKGQPPKAKAEPKAHKKDPDDLALDLTDADTIEKADLAAVGKKQRVKDADELYEYMLQEINDDIGEGIIWLKSEDMLKAPVVQEKLENLAPLINILSGKCLIRAAKTVPGRGGETTFTCRSREDAKKIASLTGDEQMVFSNVEDSQEKGIWVRNLKQKTNLHASIVDKALKKLEGNKLIKGVKNVKHPMQKTYILYHIVPSDEITGGTFFDAGTLDQSMIDELSNIIVYHVQQQSWAKGRARPVRRAHTPPVIDSHGQPRERKRKRTMDIEDAVANPKLKQRAITRRDDAETDTITTIAYPAGSREYPSTESIHAYITGTGILRDKGATMTISDLQGVIDVLVWDNKLEKILDGYRTVRGVNPRQPGALYNMETDTLGGPGGSTGNGLTQSACWRCPVFDICGEGKGPINAHTCVYFEDWLMG